MVQVSVIMPVFNIERECVLDMAIRSILAQTLSNFELIICEDASTDGTKEFLRKWNNADARISILHNDARVKAGGTRNRCMEKARGKYIALMDADDFSFPERLLCQFQFLERHPEAAFVGTRGVYFHEKPRTQGKNYLFVQNPSNKDFLMTLPFVHASIMFRREVLEKAHGYRTARWVTRSEDYDLLMRLYAAGLRGANLSQTLYGIRLNQGTYRRRKYRYRFCECAVKWSGFRKMGLFPEAIPYAVKPLMVGLLPTKALEYMKEKCYRG